ncbi:tol-pal system protein YbgF [Idiomarina sp. M1R2S28]|uniref:Cell division coordinator CpoB n=1 Tax=Idiomarina rhizosphaerae TaxID=2961572 RepID=A0A9X2JTG7_9GAMM|nr:tol-pal system protein YbgF [Idiomarina rhizosphaerae]MCP1339885.1 tol-pal system protein YbgF [Idiomarina rhizosphaerae]
MRKTLLAVCLCVPGVVMAQAPVSGLSSSGNVEQRLEQIERMLEARSSAQLEMLNQLGSLQQDVAELRGITEEHEYRLEQLLQRQRELYQEIDRRFSNLKSSNNQSEAASNNYNNLEQVPTQTDNSSYSPNLSENDAYDKAIALVLEDKRYDEAIPAFESFLKNFPNSTYSPNAHYWLGQLFFAKRQYDQAKQQFETVVNDYPDSNKRGDCLLKLGAIASEQDKSADAKAYYEQVIKEYPESTEANLAKQRLNQ